MLWHCYGWHIFFVEHFVSSAAVERVIKKDLANFLIILIMNEIMTELMLDSLNLRSI